MHVIGEVQVLLNGPKKIRLLTIAQRLVIRFVFGIEELVGLQKLVVRIDAAVVHADAVCFGVAVHVVVVLVVASFGSFTIETQPLGPTTSFTKKATSLIIGPHPAPYHPTDPSSNVTWSWP